MLTHDTPILLIDNNAAVQKTVSKALHSAGYANIHVSDSAGEALEKIKAAIETEQLYKIIFLDWTLPEEEGLAFLTTCRDELNLKDAAIILLTAATAPKGLLNAMGRGATSYMTKPLSAEDVLRKVEQVGNWVEAQEGDA